MKRKLGVGLIGAHTWVQKASARDRSMSQMATRST